MSTTIIEPWYLALESGVDFPTDVLCPKCQERHTAQQIKNGKPALELRLNCFVLRREFRCTKCKRRVRWWQRCTVTGFPIPHVVFVIIVSRPGASS